MSLLCLARHPQQYAAAAGRQRIAGFADRLAAELASLRPPGQPMTVYMSPEPQLDAWRGAAALAAGSRYTGGQYGAYSSYSNGNDSAAAGGTAAAVGAGLFGDPFAPGSGAMTRQQYEEAGVDYLREYKGFKYPELL